MLMSLVIQEGGTRTRIKQVEEANAATRSSRPGKRKVYFTGDSLAWCVGNQSPKEEEESQYLGMRPREEKGREPKKQKNL
jgi:hypothetical protein